MITPDQFTSGGTAWIDAFGVVVGHFISQAGLIVAAVYGLAKAVQTGEASLKGMQAKQDAQEARIEAMEKRQAGSPAPQPPLPPSASSEALPAPEPTAEVLHA